MLPFLKKIASRTDGTSQAADPFSAIDPSIASDFVPYYCHYNPHTLLTKNGELMQTIKIASNASGLDYESGVNESSILREAIRRATLEHVKSDKIALWVHTFRKRKPIRYRGEFKEDFPGIVHERWQQKNHWKYQYYNEIYVSVLHEGQGAPLADTKNLKHTIRPKTNREFRNHYLDTVYEELDRTVLDMMASIRGNFNAQRLTLVERIPSQAELPVNQAVFYSEPMEFLGTLLNLRSEPFLLPQADLSKALFTTAQTFGFNALETKNAAGKRRFAAVLTLKQYREVPSETSDRLLQAPMEFIVSETFHFIPHTGALKQYKEQKELFETSGDLYCIQASGIEDMMSSQTEKPTDFGEHQISIMIMSDEFRYLDGEIAGVQEAFADLGLVTIREDVKLEECFWSQLPGNFEFIRRRDTVNTSRIGGFARLNRYPNGIAVGNHWGDAVTILPTLVGSPYFFNFHYQDNGHTVLFDFNSFNDQTGSVLTNFLLSETRKYNSRLYIFDRERSADLYFRKLGGSYHNFSKLDYLSEKPQVKLNPFSLPDNPRNRSFLLAWACALISPEVTLPDAQKATLKAGIEHLYNGDAAKRNLGALVEYVASQDVSLAKPFGKWLGAGAYGGIFDALHDELDLQQALHAFDMSPVAAHKECVIPVFSYLLHRIIAAIDGRPAIIVVHECQDVLTNDFIAPRLESLLEMLQQNNAMVIFTTKKPLNLVQSSVCEVIMKNTATQLYLPDDIMRDYARPEWGLGAYESRQLRKMERQKGDFLMRQNNENIALRAAVKDLDELYAVFSNDSKNLAAALGKFSSAKQAG